MLQSAQTPVFVRNSFYKSARNGSRARMPACPPARSPAPRPPRTRARRSVAALRLPQPLLLCPSAPLCSFGEWDVLPLQWEDNHAFSADWDACGHTWENAAGWHKACNASQLAVIRGFQEQFSAAVAPALDPSSAHGAFIDSCPGCHCQGLWNSMEIGNDKGNVTERDAPQTPSRPGCCTTPRRSTRPSRSTRRPRHRRGSNCGCP